ncbi:MAG TPA: hypothetical protein VFJ11_08865 [Gaiellaceae bacterium]|nr:hypothetical protein [Gaiellaceae bacterium]
MKTLVRRSLGDGVLLLGGLLVLVIAVAPFRAGGTAGWVLGGFPLGLVGAGA